MPEPTHRYHFSLHLGNSEIARYYQGSAREISVQADTGERLRFAARHIRPFLTSEGIRGRFLLATDKNHHFLSLTKLS